MRNTLKLCKSLNSNYLYVLKVAVVISIIGYSCNHKNSGLPVISPAATISGEYPLSEIAEDLSYLRLNNMYLLSDIKGIKATGNGFFIRTDAGLSYFGTDGKYINQIGQKGDGPGEYSYAEDFAIDDSRKQVYVTNGYTVYVYDFNGNFLRSFKPANDFRSNQIVYHNDCLYFPVGLISSLQNKGNEEWIKTDLNGNLIQKQTKSQENVKSAVFYRCNLCFNIDSKLFYWNQLSDTIFQINEGKSPAYVFANDEFRLKQSDIISFEKFQTKNSWSLMSIWGSKRFMIFEYWLLQNRRFVYTIHDQKHQKMNELATVGDGITKFNDIDNGPIFVPKSNFKTNDEEYLISWVNAFELKALVASEAFKTSTPKYPEKKRELEKLANSLSDNDNPVLMLVKLKN